MYIIQTGLVLNVFLFSCLLNGKLFSNFERTKYLDKQCVNTKTHFLHVTTFYGLELLLILQKPMEKLSEHTSAVQR